MAVVAEDLKIEEAPSATPRDYAALILGNRRLMLGLVIFVVILGAVLVGAFTLDASLRRSGSVPRKLPPGVGGVLGTTSVGQSVAAQMTEAVPNSILVGLIAATLGTVIGATLGFISGYFGGWLDAVLRVLIDVFLAVPTLLFLVLIAALVRGVSVWQMALIIGLFAWSWPARAIRAQVLSLKTRPFVDVARISGMSGLEIILRELMPQMLPWMGANFVNAFIVAILAEAGLSILGLGPQREMTLGMMVYWSLTYGAILQNLWWWWLTPVLTLMILFLALYLIHLGLDEVSNPRLRSHA
ncbi:MAG TPA: ABC transporter permease [Anaerolineae bacterium]|nr:ABC transporter permease [Anaerolineae bacterium]